MYHLESFFTVVLFFIICCVVFYKMNCAKAKACQRSYMKTPIRVAFFLITIGIFALWQYKIQQFDFFVFTQQWPQSVCININDTKPDSGCVMSPKVRNWTIHGLWPSKVVGKGPFNCNSSWPFNMDKIETLRDELNIHWPNMIGHTEPDAFWKHEWLKHGTCAASDPQFDSEFKYFNTSLSLRKTYDLKRIFGSQGLKPNKDTNYSLKEFRDALKSFTKTRCRLQCVVKKDHTSQLIAQIEICLNKKLKPINCVAQPQYKYMPYNPDYEDCFETIPLAYPPLTNR